MSNLIFPSYAYIQVLNDNGIPPESKLVIEELKKRNIKYKTFVLEDIVFGSPLNIKMGELVVGDYSCTKMALECLKISFPPAPDYPTCLKYLLNRKIWCTTLKELEKQLLLMGENYKNDIFIKPEKDIKAFSGLIVSLDWISYLYELYDENLSIICSEIINIKSEYRVYVVNGKIRKISFYQGDVNFGVDVDIIKKAVDEFYNSELKIEGFAIDFAVIEKCVDNNKEYLTTLIEVNYGFSIGAYNIDSVDYTDMLIECWKQITNYNI